METALAEYLGHAPVFVRNRDGLITHWTQGAAELFGYSWAEAQGRISHDLLKTKFPIQLVEIERRLSETGSWQGLLQHTCADGKEIWTESVWRLRSASIGDARVVEVNTDVTIREILSREIDHRVKNTLAIVQGMARLSFKGSDRSDYSRFESRLVALSRAHNLLVQHSWQTADLTEVLGRVVGAFGLEGRFDVRGEALMLKPNSVIAYSLAFHELVTNALKHGALSTEEGMVSVEWSRVGLNRDRIHLIWREHGGPPVIAPTLRGFGSTLIERAISAELGEKVQLRFEPEGLICEFDGPIQKDAAETLA
jgi:PAS domain S-box-containing protein